MSKRWLWTLPIAVALTLWATAPRPLQFDATADLPDPGLAALIPGTEERILRREPGVRTPLVVVSLHGFSATRQETAPLAELVAVQLDANLVEARLAGHGLISDPLRDVMAEHWLADADRVFATAAELGDRFVVIGTSTGATLAATILDRRYAEHIDTLVWISPNFAPRDERSKWLTYPGGPLLARLLVGKQRCWEPQNELQGRFWSTCYPTAAAVEVMRLVERALKVLPGRIDQRLLMFYSQEDTVVSPEVALSVFNAIEAPQKQAIEVSDSGDKSHHVLAGDILSPRTTSRLAAQVVEFIGRRDP